MKETDRNKIVRDAVLKFGKESQTLKAIEEFAELSVELAKHLQGDVSEEHLRDELADAYIMLKQMFVVFDSYNIMRHVDVKVKKLKHRIAVNAKVKRRI